jgi:UDP-glucose 4-epimerase
LRVLVTGAAGFVGKHLAEAAAMWWETTAVHRTAGENLQNNTAVADLSRRSEVQALLEKHRPEVILHAAARIPQAPPEDLYAFFDDNVRATANLYHAALATGVRRIVFSSSMSVYGPPQSLPVSEDHPLVPDLPYALSKIQAELIGQHFACSGLETTVLRYSGIFGLGQRSGAVPAFISRCLRDEQITVNALGRPSSDFVWIQDVVQANLRAAQYSQATQFEVMNIGSGVELTILQLAEKVRDLCGSRSAIGKAEGSSPRDFRFYYDIGKARRELGFSPASPDAALTKCIEEKRMGLW